MSPEAANVFIAEDSDVRREALGRAVKTAGHGVFIEVDNLQDGLAAVVQARELGVNVALVDGTLSYDDVSAYGNAVLGADASMSKRDYDPVRLGELIRDL